MLYRTVKTDIWSDPWFQELSPYGKVVFLYLFTNDRVSACGAVEVSLSRIAFETKVPVKKIETELAGFGDRIFWIPERNLIVVRNFYRHQRAQSSENFTKAARKAVAELPEKARVWLTGVYSELSDTHPQPIPNPSPTLGDKETATATATEEIPPQSPKGESRRKAPDLRGFAEFWLLYPRKVAKGAAETAWAKLAADERDGAIAAIERQRHWPCFTQAPPEKQPHPATWLNARRWEDEPPQTNGHRELSDDDIHRLPVNHHLRIQREGLRVV